MKQRKALVPTNFTVKNVSRETQVAVLRHIKVAAILVVLLQMFHVKQAKHYDLPLMSPFLQQQAFVCAVLRIKALFALGFATRTVFSLFFSRAQKNQKISKNTVAKMRFK